MMPREWSWGNARTDVPQWVYRYEDADGRVLYVGMTNNIQQRDRQHQNVKWWRPFAVRLVLTEYSDRDAAREGELQTIQQHTPVGNLNNNPRRSGTRRDYMRSACRGLGATPGKGGTETCADREPDVAAASASPP